MNNAPKRTTVVVTGIGVISGSGMGVNAFWENMLAGRSSIGPIQRFDTDGIPCKIGGEALEFDARDFMDQRDIRRHDRYTHLALAAARLAMDDARLEPARVDSDRFGVLIGSGIGGVDAIGRHTATLYEKGPGKLSPFTIPSIIPNTATSRVAIELDARGPNFGVVSACATGSHALGLALRMLQYGEADVMLAGGSEACVTRLAYAGFCAMRAMSTGFNDEPARASRPFDARRDGFVMGEGGGVLLLETQAHALARGARAYCELAGYAATCDAFHITAPQPEGRGLSKAVGHALADAGLEPAAVDYVNAHGTSTPHNDRAETRALHSAFGEHAARLHISSTKSMTGHMLGAAGGIEAAVCCKALDSGQIPPTINYEQPDPDCDLDYVTDGRRASRPRVALSNSLGFGGHNTVLVFRRTSPTP